MHSQYGVWSLAEGFGDNSKLRFDILGFYVRVYSNVVFLWTALFFLSVFISCF